MRDEEVAKFNALRTAEELKLRYLLFRGHKHDGHPDARYGDDGEMQCNICFCDFVRDPANALDEKIVAWNMREYVRLNPLCELNAKGGE